MKNNDRPAWMDVLSAEVEEAFNLSGIGEDRHAAAIFIAVRSNPDGTKHVIHEIRGGDAPLAEAVGALVYNRMYPGIIPLAAAAALQMRHMEDQENFKKLKPKNKKRK